jgi:hypothetical protein
MYAQVFTSIHSDERRHASFNTRLFRETLSSLTAITLPMRRVDVEHRALSRSSRLAS